MNKLNKKITFISNVILSVVIILVMAYSFLPEPIVPIYNANHYEAIYNGNTEQKNLSLMFNVYENTKVVNDILDVLGQNNVKATFFVGGCWADDNEKTLCRIISEGHEIGNHGYFHKDHKNLTEQQNFQEIVNAGKMIEALCGFKPTLFAPPSGSFSTTTLKVAKDLNYKVIMWSKDTIDWRDSDENLIFSRATSNVKNGDFILFHPKPHTLNVLPKILENYRVLGYSLVTVSQNLYT